MFLERQTSEAWERLDDLCHEMTNHVGEIATRVDKLSSFYHCNDNLQQLRTLLSFQSVASHKQVNLPCIMFPDAKNARFFD